MVRLVIDLYNIIISGSATHWKIQINFQVTKNF